jgi:hypothetical protein
MDKPTEDQIDDVLNACVEAEEDGFSKWPGMTYEQGVQAALLWVGGNGENPMDD